MTNSYTRISLDEANIYSPEAINDCVAMDHNDKLHPLLQLIYVKPKLALQQISASLRHNLTTTTALIQTTIPTPSFANTKMNS